MNSFEHILNINIYIVLAIRIEHVLTSCIMSTKNNLYTRASNNVSIISNKNINCQSKSSLHVLRPYPVLTFLHRSLVSP